MRERKLLKRTVSGIMLTLLFVSMLTLAFNIQTVRASGTIYIRANGSIDPPTAPIQRDGHIYTFTNNIYDEIVVERDGIVVDGAGYTLQGTGVYGSKGIYLFDVSNVTIRNTSIEEFSVGSKGFHYGVYLETAAYSVISGNNIIAPYGVYLTESSDNKIYGNEIRGGWAKSSTDYSISLFDSDNNMISGNKITENWNGILLSSSHNNTVSGNEISANSADGVYLYVWSQNNTISGNNIKANNWNGIHLTVHHNTISENNITNNQNGIYLGEASDNLFYHNNFVYNSLQVKGSGQNDWDSGYPSGGNYWSDYTGTDQYSGPDQDQSGSDGLGDAAHEIDASDQDNYPLMGPFGSFDAGTWGETTYHVDTVSNSTVSNFHFSESEKLICFNVTGPDGTVGFCRVTISNALLGGPYVVSVNDSPPVTISEWTNGTHTFIYLTYIHSTKMVEITGTTAIPEFSTWISMLLAFIAFTVAIAIRKRKTTQNTNPLKRARVS